MFRGLPPGRAATPLASSLGDAPIAGASSWTGSDAPIAGGDTGVILKFDFSELFGFEQFPIQNTK